VIWRVGLVDIDVTDLIFFDECGVNLSMTPAYAWSAKGQRAPGSTPKNWGDNVTVAAGLSLREGIVAPLQLAGSMDGMHFEAYLEQFLLPQMRPGQFLVVDNLGAHKTVAAQEACRKAGVWLVFLPPYSPDLNPIEKAWSKLKALLRRARARTHSALDKALAEALRAISISDAVGWFRASGLVA
jgi:transposase